MLRYYYINRGWMVSRTAQWVYRCSAGLSLLLFVFLSTIKVVRQIPEPFLPFARLILLVGVLGAAITMVAMEYFLFGFDSSSALRKMFWFCVMLFPPLGPALYCFIVYSRSSVLAQSNTKTLSRASM